MAEKKHDLLKAETLYRKARALNDPHYLPYERRAYLLLESTRYEEAEWQFYEMELRKQGTVPPLSPTLHVAAPMLLQPPTWEYPSLSGPGSIHRNPKSAKEFFMTGKAHFEQNDQAAAEPYFKQAMRLAPDHKEVYYYLGTICAGQGRYEEAEVYLRRLVELRPEVDFMPTYLGEVYKNWGRLEDAERIYQKLLNTSQSEALLISAYLSMGWIMNAQGRYSEQELLLWDLHELDEEWGQKELVKFYYAMIEKFPKNADWRYRFADFKYKVIGHAYGVYEFKDLHALDSNYAAIGHALALVGRYYLVEGEQPGWNENDAVFYLDAPKAIHYLELAAKKAPTIQAVQYDLVMAYLKVFRYAEALAVLDSLRKNGALDFANRLVLADLLLRSGRFDEAKSLIDKAWDIQPKPVASLPELTGKWHQLHGDTEQAIGFYKQELPFGEREGKANLCYTLARLCAQADKKEPALEWLRQASENGFDSPLVMKYDSAMVGFSIRWRLRIIISRFWEGSRRLSGRIDGCYLAQIARTKTLSKTFQPIE